MAPENTYPYLADIVLYLDDQLHCHEFKALDLAFNGLQVGENLRQVRTVVAAVDASLESFERAAGLAADLLLVHHGIFWGQISPVAGYNYQRLSILLENHLALYAAHLPLDANLFYGNNIYLAESLSLQNICGFGSYKGRFIGCVGEFARPHSMDDICQILAAPANAVRLEFSRRAKSCGIQKVGIVSGAGALALEEAAAKGCDLLLTGEFVHQYYHAAKELAVSVLALGHYHSEMGGVLRLLQLLKKQWPSLSIDFIDLPTGL